MYFVIVRLWEDGQTILFLDLCHNTINIVYPKIIIRMSLLVHLPFDITRSVLLEWLSGLKVLMILDEALLSKQLPKHYHDILNQLKDLNGEDMNRKLFSWVCIRDLRVISCRIGDDLKYYADRNPLNSVLFDSLQSINVNAHGSSGLACIVNSCKSLRTLRANKSTFVSYVNSDILRSLTSVGLGDINYIVDAMSRIEQHCSQLKEIEIRWHASFNDENLVTFLSKFQYLQRIVLRSKIWSLMTEILERCKQVPNVEIGNYRYKSTATSRELCFPDNEDCLPIIGDVLRQFTRWTSIEITDTSGDVFQILKEQQSCPTLESMKCFVGDVTSVTLFNFLSQCSRLRCLRLVFDCDIDLNDVFTFPNQIEILVISSWFDEVVVKQILTNCTRLKRCTLSRVKNLTDMRRFLDIFYSTSHKRWEELEIIGETVEFDNGAWGASKY